MGLSFESASALRFAQKPGARRATGPIVGERAATGQTVQLLLEGLEKRLWAFGSPDVFPVSSFFSFVSRPRHLVSGLVGWWLLAFIGKSLGRVESFVWGRLNGPRFFQEMGVDRRGSLARGPWFSWFPILQVLLQLTNDRSPRWALYIYIYILDRCGRTLCPGPQWFSDSGTPGTLTLYAGIGSGPYVSNRFQVDREQWMGRAERLLVAFGRLQCMLVTCATDLT